MVSAAWVAGRLSPYRRYAKAAAIGVATVALVGTGALVEHWRMRGKLAAHKADYYQSRARRGEDYADALVRAAQMATRRTEEAQALLSQARATRAKALANTAHKAPNTPEWACLDKPLPPDYLETFR